MDGGFFLSPVSTSLSPLVGVDWADDTLLLGAGRIWELINRLKKFFPMLQMSSKFALSPMGMP